jgi:multicomponent Na+:H+ antiporter subunit F
MTTGLIPWAAGIAAVLVALGCIPVTVRLLAGPSSADRVIATDMLGLLGVCIAALVALIAWHPAFLDIAFGIALVGFLGAIAFARLLERAGAASAQEPAE